MGNGYSKKLVLLFLLVFGLVFAFGDVSLAANLTVGPGDSYDHKSIQDAIDNAASGDTIDVYAGIYQEDLSISKNNLTLRSVDGEGQAEIRGEGGENVIEIANDYGVTIDGFNITPGSGDTFGIYFNGGASTSPVTITNNTIEGFSLGYGVAAAWDYLSGTTFSFVGNTIMNCSTGVSVGGFESATVNISENTVSDCQYGIVIEGISTDAPTELRIENNTITASGPSDNEGIYIGNAEDSTYVTGNKVEGYFYYGIRIGEIGSDEEQPPVVYIERNQVTGENYGYGLYISDFLYEFTGSAEVYIRYNTLEGNETGFGVSSYDGAAGSTVSIVDNNFVGNSVFGFKNLDTVTIDAQGNWWGDASGPYHPSTNPEGLGDWVTNYVDYGNWRTTAWEEEDDSSSGCSAGILNPLFLLLLAPLGLLLRKSR